MTQDDQHFLDILAEYTRDIRKFTGDVFDQTDRHFAEVASYIKRSVPPKWLPEHARPAPPPPTAVSAAYIDRVQTWISRNRALTAALVAFFGTGGFLLWREHSNHKQKRKARRANNGARKDVVVLAGSPSSPIVKSLSQDLERRGFIVYIVCTDMEEEQQVHGESRPDIRPLHIDIVDPVGTRAAIERFTKSLRRPQHAFSGAAAHNLNFRALILVPDNIYPSGPIETISPELWSDALNAKVLKTITLAQAFLPSICDQKARVLMLIPSIVAALRPPFHSVETSVVSALEGFTASLRSELDTLGIKVCQLKLGTFDYSHVGARHHLQAIGSPDTEQWSTAARQSYASNFVNQSRIGRSRGLFGSGSNSGSSMRDLHHAVFDAITQKHPRRVWRIGRGSVAYDVVGSWVPSGLVGWMLGVQRVSLDQTSAPRLEDSVQSWEKVEAQEMSQG
ncbi:DUF1776-domain-containing protein [Sporormia fimetaria CBS 119925]|uniref:DUF1776-domain-containing protein n=1 Tax=Sporormia fimetaria CBS 119925 TaxID=1340428 RepID=A0A6A6VP72_9PLEO|nr:DUF1776-domain-containing protein [Sporormia fimetaria CBS 119925]